MCNLRYNPNPRSTCNPNPIFTTLAVTLTLSSWNNFPLKVINLVMREIAQKKQGKSAMADADAQLVPEPVTELSEVKLVQITLPYAETKGESIMKEVNKKFKSQKHQERVLDHAGHDRNSHVYKHSLTTGHTGISMENVKIINKNFPNYYKRKVSEAIYIKQKRPILNIKDTSVPLKLLN